MIEETLLDAAAADTTGTWKRVHAVHPCTVTVEGTFSATVTLYVSNTQGVPTDSSTVYPVLKTLTAVGAVVTDGPYRWMKAAVSSYSSGAITVCVCGANNVASRG